MACEHDRHLDPAPPCAEHGPDEPHDTGCAFFDGMIHAFVQVIAEDYRRIDGPTPVAVIATDEHDILTIKIGIGHEAAEALTVEQAINSGPLKN